MTSSCFKAFPSFRKLPEWSSRWRVRILLVLAFCLMTPLTRGEDTPDIPADCPVSGKVQSIQKLQKGWNQIFIPVLLDEESFQKVLQEKELFYYETGNKAYRRVTREEELSPNQRYWICAEEDEDLLLTGSCLGVSSTDVRIDEETKHWIINQRGNGKGGLLQTQRTGPL